MPTDTERIDWLNEYLGDFVLTMSGGVGMPLLDLCSIEMPHSRYWTALEMRQVIDFAMEFTRKREREALAAPTPAKGDGGE